MEKETKKCTKCKKELPLSDFVKNKSKKGGLGSWCKKCNREYRKEKKSEIETKFNQLVDCLEKAQLLINELKGLAALQMASNSIPRELEDITIDMLLEGCKKKTPGKWNFIHGLSEIGITNLRELLCNTPTSISEKFVATDYFKAPTRGIFILVREIIKEKYNIEWFK